MAPSWRILAAGFSWDSSDSGGRPGMHQGQVSLPGPPSVGDALVEEVVGLVLDIWPRADFLCAVPPAQETGLLVPLE